MLHCMKIAGMKTLNALILFLSLSSTSVWAMDTNTAKPVPSAETYCPWEMVDYSIDRPLCGLAGDALQGQRIVVDSGRGNCLACHQLPIEGVEAYGTIAPPLAGIAKRLNTAQLRLRVVDSRNLNPLSIMPGYYRDPALINRPAQDAIGKTFLQAQEIEDVVAYLGTLK